MQNGWSYIRDSNDFINKIKNLTNIPSNSTLVRADAVVLYPSIPDESGSNAIKEALENRTRKFVPTSEILKMLELVLQNNHFEFNGNFKQQLSGTAIETKCAPPYAYIFMDKVEIDFLESQNLNRWFGFHILMTSFLFGLTANRNFSSFFKNLIKLILT